MLLAIGGGDDYKSLGHLIFLSNYVSTYYNKINITNFITFSLCLHSLVYIKLISVIIH